MTKFQDENQVKGRLGELVAAFAFPPAWVVRPILHDFGIDLELEVFHSVALGASGIAKYQTRGEHLYLQVKTSDSIKPAEFTDEGRTGSSVAFNINTADLKLAESMGAGVPLVLLLVDRSTQVIYYLCLTDYVAKCLRGDHATWANQKTLTIQVPSRNVLQLSGKENDLRAHWDYFERLARRGKLYSAFNLLHHVQNELDNRLEYFGDRDFSSRPAFRTIALPFLKSFRELVPQVAALDIWQYGNSDFGTIEQGRTAVEGAISKFYYTEDDLEAIIDATISNDEFEALSSKFVDDAYWSVSRFSLASSIGATHEQIHRFERLPRFMGGLNEELFLEAETVDV